MMATLLHVSVVLCVLVVTVVSGDYVTYVKTEDNKFEPVMEPVSSTIEPVPMYKLVRKLSYNFDDADEYEKNKLLTVSNIHHHKERKSKQYDKDRKFVKIEPMN